MDKKKEIVKTITDMSGKYAPSIVFADWVHCMALAIQNSCQMVHNHLWHEREQEYISLMNRYSSEEQRQMSGMLFLLTLAFDDKMTDLLGEIYMEAGCGNKGTGQFFTPFHLSQLTAELTITEVSEENPLILHEPSSGGGGMIIASARVLEERGLNYQRCMKVTAQDLDWNSVYMTYVQLSLLGIDAEVIQGNTLSDSMPEPKQIFLTPNRMGMLI